MIIRLPAKQIYPLDIKHLSKRDIEREREREIRRWPHVRGHNTKKHLATTHQNTTDEFTLLYFSAVRQIKTQESVRHQIRNQLINQTSEKCSTVFFLLLLRLHTFILVWLIGLGQIDNGSLWLRRRAYLHHICRHVDWSMRIRLSHLVWMDPIAVPLSLAVADDRAQRLVP